MIRVKQSVSWAIMFVLSLVLIIVGFQGSLGKVLGCIFTPAEIRLNE